MAVIYRKQGAVVRWENGTLVRVMESGVAIEEANLFTCHPEQSEGPPPVNPADLLTVAEKLKSLHPERLILTHGIAHHQYGDREWREETRRLHLSLLHGRLRVLFDQADFDTSRIETVAAALRRAEAEERTPPPRLRLAPNVTAALLPHLAGLAPPNVRLLQTAGGIDGYGNPVVEAQSGWPNVFRPSYRIRPVRMPLDLRLECDVTAIDPELPIAIALLAPAEGPLLRTLIEDGARVYPATIRVTRISAASSERGWYPFGGGSFGAEMML